MDKEQKYKNLGLNITYLCFLGIRIENFKENANILAKSSIYFSVPKQYSSDFITLISDGNRDDEESLKTEDGIIKLGKEGVKEIINSYFALYDDEIEGDITDYFKLYAKVRDEEWDLEKGKEKVNYINQELQKIIKSTAVKNKNEWKEV